MIVFRLTPTKEGLTVRFRNRRRSSQGWVLSWLAGFSAVGGLSYGMVFQGTDTRAPMVLLGFQQYSLKPPEIAFPGVERSLFTDNRSSLQQ